MSWLHCVISYFFRWFSYMLWHCLFSLNNKPETLKFTIVSLFCFFNLNVGLRKFLSGSLQYNQYVHFKYYPDTNRQIVLFYTIAFLEFIVITCTSNLKYLPLIYVYNIIVYYMHTVGPWLGIKLSVCLSVCHIKPFHLQLMLWQWKLIQLLQVLVRSDFTLNISGLDDSSKADFFFKTQKQKH